MKTIICTICALAFAMSMTAQEENKTGWVVGEQESSFPGEMIEYAVSQARETIEGEDGPIVVSLNAMIFRGALRYFLSSKGENFVVDHLQMQRVLINIDDGRATNYALVGNNTYTSNSLTFDGSYKNQFKKLLKKGGKICTAVVEFEKSGQKTVSFNIEGLPDKFLK
ncbi:MAG: hypothetical protein IJ139_04395 [Bacteroidaceae bacterium]|nr:hypothetical protein [Bacteroidaceae bacterium]MBQ9176090.1 hypothetical protein [Bacteroidaceae bacterium]MBR1378912.1 hypothetical protein [Bacteroidaceae bacterium]